MDLVDLERRFGGIAGLYGEAALERFNRAHICVIGIGGVGTWAVEALARSAIGSMTLIDLDHVAESNINRQLHALESTLGQAKVVAMRDRVGQINPHCKVFTVEEMVGADNLSRLIDDRFDYVIDCIDDARTKAALIAWCRRNRLRIITVGAAGAQTDPTRIRTADLSRSFHDALLARTRKQLRSDYGFSKNPKRRFSVPCVFSEEQLRRPQASGQTCTDESESAGSLTCAGGLGSVTTVTATFGFAAVAQVLDHLATQPQC